MKHEIPYLLYFQVIFWLNIIASVFYVIELGGARSYPYERKQHRWEDMLRLVSGVLSAVILYTLCWGNW